MADHPNPPKTTKEIRASIGFHRARIQKLKAIISDKRREFRSIKAQVDERIVASVSLETMK